MLRKIVEVKDPILRAKAKELVKIDKKVKNLAKDLEDTLRVQKEPEGVGLAACQIGKSVRMFAMVTPKGIKVVINPKVLKIVKNKPKKTAKKSTKKRKKEKNTILEGCLSIPYYYGPLKRPDLIVLEYYTPEGVKVTEKFKGFQAQIVQHEIDHLNGVLFIDKIIKDKKPLYRVDPKTDEWEEVELV